MVASESDRSSRELAQAYESELLARTGGHHAVFTPCREMAIEWAIAAVRLRSAGQKFKIITFVGNELGQTLACHSASGFPESQADLGPLVAGFVHCPWGDASAVREAIDDQTAAILIQPIQTANGLQMASTEFLQELREIADTNGLWLLSDESSFPLGVSGALDSQSSFGFEPHARILAEGLAGEFPLGVVIWQDQLPDALQTHPLLQTSPVAATIATAGQTVLEDLNEESLQSLQAVAAMCERALISLVDDFEFVKEIRQRGILFAVEMDIPVEPLVAELSQHGDAFQTAGSHTLRIQPPFKMTSEDLESLVADLHQVLQSVERAADPTEEPVAGP